MTRDEFQSLFPGEPMASIEDHARSLQEALEEQGQADVFMVGSGFVVRPKDSEQGELVRVQLSAQENG